MRVSDGTLCPLGQSNKAIGHESQIGPCVATHRVNNCQACCVLRKRLAPSRQGNGCADKKEPWLADTKRDKQSGEDHSQRASAGSNSRAECRDKNGAASSRWGDFSLDIPFYRTSAITSLIKHNSQRVPFVRLHSRIHETVHYRQESEHALHAATCKHVLVRPAEHELRHFQCSRQRAL